VADTPNMPKVIIAATLDLLRQHAPFDRMDEASLLYLAAQLKLAYYAKGRVILEPRHGAVRTLFIIQRGLVRGDLSADSLPQPGELEFGEGECFPLGAVADNRPTAYTYTAAEDSFCYETGADVVAELMQRSPVFHAFQTQYANSLLQRSYAALQSDYAQLTVSQQPMHTSLRELIRREPLVCKPQDSLQAALQAMQRGKTGSIVIVSTEAAPLGIFTERDLLKRTAAGDIDLAQSIEHYMTRALHTLPAAASGAEAAMLMVKWGIRHVLVVEEGRLVGVVAERDLFALSRLSMRAIADSIDIAQDFKDLKTAAGGMRRLEGNMLAQGVGTENLTQLVATLNDKLTCRAIELQSAWHDLSGIDWCWIALGSEGRREQTFATDQDNGIIFRDARPAAEVRELLLPFAQAVNRVLDACGFPLCKGNIMAGNPEWCLSLAEWQSKFASWMRNPEPKALLNSTIFFDFRALWGNVELADELRNGLNLDAHDNQRFLRAMAANALESGPPLGMFRNIVTSGHGRQANTVDLKAQGSRPFVDAARIYALAAGLSQTNTPERLRASGTRLNIPSSEVEAMVDAFHFVLLLRLRHQHIASGDPGDINRIDPDRLNELDRRILKEAFRQARNVQTRLRLDFQL
jgi:CBS domain-containing protein